MGNFKRFLLHAEIFIRFADLLGLDLTYILLGFFLPVSGVILISLPFLIWYPITQKMHAEFVKKIVDKKVAKS